MMFCKSLIGLLCVAGLSCSLKGQSIKLDTVVVLPMESSDGDYLGLSVKNDRVHYAAVNSEKQELYYQEVFSNSFEVVDIRSAQNPWFSHVFTIDQTLFYGGRNINYRVDSSYTAEINNEVYSDVYSSDDYILAIEEYPDFFNPEDSLLFRLFDSNFEMVREGKIPYDFPHYLARVGSPFAISKSELCYCNTTDYTCFLYDLQSGKSEEIISLDLNDEKSQRAIDSVKADVSVSANQAKKWIPQLRDLDKQIKRVESVLYDGKHLVVVKRYPGSGFDYRLLDVFEKQPDGSFDVLHQDVHVSSRPEGMMSYENPPCYIMDSTPFVLHDGRIYLLAWIEFAEGLDKGISHESFDSNMIEYYETHAPHYAVYVYSFEPDRN